MFYHSLRLLVESFQLEMLLVLKKNLEEGPFIETMICLYSDAIHESGAFLKSCVRFIDATNIYIARPREPLEL